MKGGKGIVTCRKEWRVQLIAYIEGSLHQGKRKGATSRQWRSCAKRGERLEREDDGKMELTKGLGAENAATPTTRGMYQNCSILGNFQTPLAGCEIAAR